MNMINSNRQNKKGKDRANFETVCWFDLDCSYQKPILLGDDFSLFYDLPIKLDFECIESNVYLALIIHHRVHRGHIIYLISNI